MAQLKAARPTAREESTDRELVASYATLFERLLPGVMGTVILDRDLELLGRAGVITTDRDMLDWLKSFGWTQGRLRQSHALRELPGGGALAAFAFKNRPGEFLGAAVVHLHTEASR